MSSTRETIVAALVSRLKSPPDGITMPLGLTADRVHRFILRPIEADKLPALVAYRYDCKPVESLHLAGDSRDTQLLYELMVRVEVRAIGEPVDQVVDALEQYVRQCVFSDTSLGGLTAGARELGYEVDGAALNQHFAASHVNLGFIYYEQPYTFPDPTVLLQQVTVDDETLEETLTVPE